MKKFFRELKSDVGDGSHAYERGLLGNVLQKLI